MTTHESLASHAPQGGASDRKFGLTVGAVLAAIAAWPLVAGEPPRLWLLAVAVALIVCGIVVPRVLRPLNTLWNRLGRVMGIVMTPVIMALLFYGVLTPAGAVARLFGRDALGLRRQAGGSYWRQRSAEDNDLDMNRQF